jgi:hypothetical protein
MQDFIDTLFENEVGEHAASQSPTGVAETPLTTFLATFQTRDESYERYLSMVTQADKLTSIATTAELKAGIQSRFNSLRSSVEALPLEGLEYQELVTPDDDVSDIEEGYVRDDDVKGEDSNSEYTYQTMSQADEVENSVALIDVLDLECSPRRPQHVSEPSKRQSQSQIPNRDDDVKGEEDSNSEYTYQTMSQADQVENSVASIDVLDLECSPGRPQHVSEPSKRQSQSQIPNRIETNKLLASDDSSRPNLNEGAGRLSSIELSLRDYKPSVESSNVSEAGTSTHAEVSPTGFWEWEYLKETRTTERNGPSVMQRGGKRQSRYEKRAQRPPIQEISTNPLWKRRLANHQRLFKAKVREPSKDIAKEQRKLAQQFQSMITDFDYQSMKLKAKQRKVRRQLQQYK